MLSRGKASEKEMLELNLGASKSLFPRIGREEKNGLGKGMEVSISKAHPGMSKWLDIATTEGNLENRYWMRLKMHQGKVQL